MKKLYLILSLICLSTSISVHSQDGWFWLNPLPQGNSYGDIEFTANNTVYVSAAGNTLMKSTDGGNTFFIMANRECGGTLTFINDVTGFSSSSGGILKTTNGGNNWRYISAPVDYVLNFSTSPVVILYGLKNNKVYLSNDLGENWNLSLTALTNNSISTVHFPSNTTGYAGGKKFAIFNNARIYKTTDAGSSWDTVPLISRYEVRTLFFINNNTGFAGTTNKILRTTNGGANWDSVYSLLNIYNQLEFFDYFNGYLKNQQSILYTTDQGTNWTEVVTFHTTFLKNINEGLGKGALNNYNFLYRTTNKGANWTSITTGFRDDLWDVTFVNSETGFTGGYNRIYRTTNSGYNWQEYELNIQGWPPHVENVMFPNENTGYAGIDGGRVAKTTNCGLNWEVFKTGNYDHLHGMCFPSVDTGYAVTKQGYYLKTVNGGINWQVTGPDTVSYGDIQFMDNLTGFSGGFNYNINRGVIKRTTNGGANWFVNYLDSIFWIEDICISAQNYWFAVGYGSFNGTAQTGIIYRSTDIGLNWHYIQLPQSIASIAFSSILNGYASANNNITYKTTNGGESWFATYCINASSSHGLYFINDNTGYGVNLYGQIIKTTTGGGVLISVAPQSYIVPHTYNLYQNYPNPFNPVTKIKFDIPKAMNASLRIYDILGREVSVMVNDFLIPGTYAFDFDGSSLASGVYFYVLTGEGFVESKKMLLVK